jgi:O-antigen/teichoic acid export membrane protein
LSGQQAEAHAAAAAGTGAAGPGRARRLVSGWSASLVQMILGLTQQIALIPVFLRFWSGDVLAAWLVIYATSSLVLMADGGLHPRAINRFLKFKACSDDEGRTAQFYAALLPIYVGLACILAVLVWGLTRFVSPAAILRFQGVADFDAAFLLVVIGSLLTLPGLLAGALYRARGQYGRSVWIQNCGMLAGQLAQLVAVVTTGSLFVVAVVFVTANILTVLYMLTIDAPRRFNFLHYRRVRHSIRWAFGQLQKSAAFGVVAAAEIALVNLPVLLVSALVSDRMAVAQWGLTRVVAGLLRALCVQTTLPLAAELGHDHAIGDKERLRHLYARGSMFVTLLAAVVVAALLPFWQDFFALWTHGSVPYDGPLAVTLLIGTGLGAPALLAMNYAFYSDRAALLVRTKGLQLVLFMILSLLLIPPFGPLGAAIAIVASDLLIQSGLLAFTIIRQTLQHPVRHILFLAGAMAAVTVAGWALGMAIRAVVPWSGATGFVAECAIWLAVAAIAASPLAHQPFREWLIAAIPR